MGSLSEGIGLRSGEDVVCHLKLPHELPQCNTGSPCGFDDAIAVPRIVFFPAFFSVYLLPASCLLTDS